VTLAARRYINLRKKFRPDRTAIGASLIDARQRYLEVRLPVSACSISRSSRESPKFFHQVFSFSGVTGFQEPSWRPFRPASERDDGTDFW
jgi:hypothetical protein